MITPKMLRYGFLILCAAVALAIVFKKCPGDQDTGVHSFTPPAKIGAMANDTEAVYKKKADSLNTANNQLKSVNAVTLDSLHMYQARDRFLADLLRKRPKGDTAYLSSTNGTIDEYVANTQKADSLCDSAISNLQAQVSNREQLISSKDTLYSRLRSTFDFVLQQQVDLLKYNQDLKKQIRKKKFATAFWKITSIAAGLFILEQKIK